MWVFLWVILILIGVIIFACKILDRFINGDRRSKKHEFQSSVTHNLESLYRRKYLLTKREWVFYNDLKPVADKLGFVVLSKVRMADLVEPIAGNNSEYYRAFSKVKAKHIDFVLCRPENLYVELLIELDDSTHYEGNARDAFVEQVYAQTGYKLFRTKTSENLEEGIIRALGNIVMPKSSITASPKTPKIETATYQFSQDKSPEDLAKDFEKQFGFKPVFLVKDKEEEHTGFPRSAEEYQRLYGNKKIEPPT